MNIIFYLLETTVSKVRPSSSVFLIRIILSLYSWVQIPDRTKVKYFYCNSKLVTYLHQSEDKFIDFSLINIHINYIFTWCKNNLSG